MRSESDSASDSGIECDEIDCNKLNAELNESHINGNGEQQKTSNINSTNDNNNPKKNFKLRIRKNIPHFLPFSIGKRTCIGQNLVRGFSFIIVANLLQQYDIGISDKNLIKMYPGCVAVPMDTYPFALTPRNR